MQIKGYQSRHDRDIDAVNDRRGHDYGHFVWLLYSGTNSVRNLADKWD